MGDCIMADDSFTVYSLPMAVNVYMVCSIPYILALLDPLPAPAVLLRPAPGVLSPPVPGPGHQSSGSLRND